MTRPDRIAAYRVRMGSAASATRPLDLDRASILAFRRRAGALDERLPRTAASLRRAAWAGLQDSVPRAALLALHARVQDIRPEAGDPQAHPRVLTRSQPHARADACASPDMERGGLECMHRQGYPRANADAATRSY